MKEKLYAWIDIDHSDYGCTMATGGQDILDKTGCEITLEEAQSEWGFTFWEVPKKYLKKEYGGK